MRRIFLLTGILRCFLILFVSILSIFALKVFFDEQTQLKWKTNYKINKLSFKVAWEKACDVATADWLYNYPRGRIFPPSVWQRSKRFLRRDAGFSLPPLPTPTKEKLIFKNFIRARNHDRIMISLIRHNISINRRKGFKVPIIRTFLEYIIWFCCFESLACKF